MSEKPPKKNKTKTTAGALPRALKKKRKPYEKPLLEKHSDIQLWAFGTMGG